MATLPCTIAEFNEKYVEFNKMAGNKSHTQEQINCAYKCFVLHYLGVECETDEQLEQCATLLRVATNGALRRGWILNEPHLV